MVDEPENLVLRALREIREQNDTILRKLDEVVIRLAAVERDLAAMKVDYAATQLASTIWVAGSNASRSG
jgi:hypothetical protein